MPVDVSSYDADDPMIPGRALAHLVLALAALPSPAFSNDVVLPKAGQKWIEVRTENFRFFSKNVWARNVSKTRQKDIDADLVSF